VAVRQTGLYVAATCLLLAAALGSTASAAGALSYTETVNTLADLPLTENEHYCSEDGEPGSDICPLRAALEFLPNLTNIGADDMVVVVPAGHYLLGTKGALPIGEPHAACKTGTVKCPVTLRGAGAGLTVIDGQNNGRILTNVSSAGPVIVQGVTLKGGNTSGSGGAIKAEGVESLTVLNSTITENHALEMGGAILATNAVTVVDSSITHNSADKGGAISMLFNPVTLLRSTVSSNKAVFGSGGALQLVDQLGGSGIDANVIDSTLVGNSASEAGGAIYAGERDKLTVRYSTITGNTASTGGGGGGVGGKPLTTLTLEGAILSGDAPNECAGIPSVNTVVANIVFGPSSCPIFAPPAPLNADPRLGAPSANGGLGATLALLRGSPAVNAGGASCPSTGAVDQRSIARPRGAACDLGAYESATDAGITLAATPDPVSVGSPLSLTATVDDSGSEPLSGVVLTVPVPTGASLVSAPAGCNAAFSATTTVTCQLGSMVPGQSVPISIAVRPERTGALSETASVTADQADYNPANDTATIASVAVAALIQGSPGGTPGTNPPTGTNGAGSAGAAGSALIGRTFTIDAHGYVTVRVSCPAIAVGGCHDALGIYSSSGVMPVAVARAGRRAALLAIAHATIKAGRTQSVRLRLNKAGRKLAQAHRSFRARLLLSAHDASGKVASHSYAVTLKRASKRHR
jgi:predicted outer membrane repeat protein